MADDKIAPQAWQFKNVMRVLKSYAPPAGEFNPAGAWEHSYNIYFLNIREGKGRAPTKGKGAGKANAVGLPAPAGTLKVASAPKSGGIELHVESSAFMNHDVTTARILCGNDRLCAPLSWDLAFTNASAEGRQYVTFSKTGAVENGVLLKDGKPVEGMKRLETHTCDWSLFDAVQRLGVENFQSALACDMLEYLDVLRENQTLKFRGRTQVECAGQSVEVREYLQYGDAVLPTHYCLDAHNRLFMVLGSRRLFVLVNEKAEAPDNE